MTDNPTALQLVQRELPTTLGDQARHAAAIEVITDALKERRTQVRDALGDSLRAAAEAEGVDGATRKLSGLGTVTLTAPEPHVKVTDDQALGAWLAEVTADPDPERPAWPAPDRRTEVVPATSAALRELRDTAQALTDQADDGPVDKLAARGLALADLVLATLTERTTWLLPAKVAELIERHPDAELVPPTEVQVDGSDRPVVQPGFVMHAYSGERVPGCEVTVARSQVTVKIDAAARKAEVARLREGLGW